MTVPLLGFGLALALIFVCIAGLTQGSLGSRACWFVAAIIAVVVGLLFLLGLAGVVAVG